MVLANKDPGNKLEDAQTTADTLSHLIFDKGAKHSLGAEIAPLVSGAGKIGFQGTRD